jgi:hypothetical protein
MKFLQLGYLALDALVNSLSGMTQSSITFAFTPFPLLFPPPKLCSLASTARRTCCSPCSRTCLKYRGTNEHLDRFVARIDAPRLGDIVIILFSQSGKDAWALGRFIRRIQMQKSQSRAAILSSDRAISITFTHPEAPTRLELKVSCQLLARQLSYMSQICNGLSTFLLGAEHLRICATGPISRQDDSDREEWLKLIRTFRNAKWVHVVGEHSTKIMVALQHSEMRREAMLPALYKLCIRGPEQRHAPLRDAVVSLIHSRQLSGHIIGVEYQRLWTKELRGTGTVFVSWPFLSRNNVLEQDPLLIRSRLKCSVMTYF